MELPYEVLNKLTQAVEDLGSIPEMTEILLLAKLPDKSWQPDIVQSKSYQSIFRAIMAAASWSWFLRSIWYRGL